MFAILVCHFLGSVFSKYASRGEAEPEENIGISMVAACDLCVDLLRKSQKFQKVGQFGMTTTLETLAQYFDLPCWT